MKKIRIRRIIVRETETTVIKPGAVIENSGAEVEPHVCPLCHSLIQPKQIAAALDRKLLTEEKKDS